MSSDGRSQDMDALTAHLDRGWDLLHRGDLVAARVSAHQILQLESESPEARALLGAIAAAEGDLEEATELLHQAMDLDPEYLEAVLYAAEVAILRGELDEALELCDRGQELCEDAEEELDVGLLRLEAMMAAGRAEEARRAAARLPEPDQAVQALRFGRVWLDLGELARAVPLLERATRTPDTEADARYFLGLALDGEGRGAEALQHLLRVAEMDRGQPDPAWAYSQEDFVALLGDTLRSLPGELRAVLERVPFRVLAHPPLELVAEGLDPRAMVFLACAPPTEGGRRAPAVGRDGWQLSCLFVYKRPVERFARSGAAVPDELRAALEEEAQSFLGLSPPDGGAEA